MGDNDPPTIDPWTPDTVDAAETVARHNDKNTFGAALMLGAIATIRQVWQERDEAQRQAAEWEAAYHRAAQPSPEDERAHALLRDAAAIAESGEGNLIALWRAKNEIQERYVAAMQELGQLTEHRAELFNALCDAISVAESARDLTTDFDETKANFALAVAKKYAEILRPKETKGDD